MHNSRRPLNRLTVILTLTLIFDLIFIGGRGLEFGDFSFSRFVFIVRTDRHNHRGGSTLYSRDYRRRE